MSVFAESLKRLYVAKKLTKKQIKAQLDNERITQEEYTEIIGA